MCHTLDIVRGHGMRELGPMGSGCAACDSINMCGLHELIVLKNSKNTVRLHWPSGSGYAPNWVSLIRMSHHVTPRVRSRRTRDCSIDIYGVHELVVFKNTVRLPGPQALAMPLTGSISFQLSFHYATCPSRHTRDRECTGP